MANFLLTCRKIIGIGRNYAEHAKELGNEVPKGVPVFFLKPPSSLVGMPGRIERPARCQDLHHEVELGLVIGKQGRHIKPEHALTHVAGYVLALDMTARDQQDAAKKKGLPWSEAKGADTFCAVGPFLPADLVPDPHALTLSLKVDGALKQRGSTSDMLFRVPELVSYLSSIMTLNEGDLILTGTPAGVGAVLPGQTITAAIEELPQAAITFPVVQAPIPEM